jgi:large subunit ribosomal protein L9
MKVILQADVKGKGKRGQLVEVSDGYARNFLLPKNLAVIATADNLNTMQQQDAAKRKQTEREKAEARALAEKLEGAVVKIHAKSGAGGRLFGSVTSKEIAEELEAQHGIALHKSKIVQEEAIKSFGSYELKCKLGYEITGTVYVVVSAEGNE